MSLADELGEELDNLANQRDAWRALAIDFVLAGRDRALLLECRGRACSMLKAETRRPDQERVWFEPLPVGGEPLRDSLYATADELHAAALPVEPETEAPETEEPEPERTEEPETPPVSYEPTQAAPDPKPRARRVWTEEQRRAQAERIRKVNARRWADKPVTTETPVSGVSVSVMLPQADVVEPTVTEPQKPTGDKRADARTAYRRYLEKGNKPSTSFEGLLIADYGLNRTEVMAIRDELLNEQRGMVTRNCANCQEPFDQPKPANGSASRTLCDDCRGLRLGKYDRMHESAPAQP